MDKLLMLGDLPVVAGAYTAGLARDMRWLFQCLEPVFV